ncbi:MAG: acyl-CoA dehydrogenase family protein, partial [Chloroflexota bacterium]
MDLSLTEQQEMLKQGVEDFRTRNATKEAILEAEETPSGYSPEMWQTAAEIGWLSMVTPEAYGGFGGSLTDAAVVFEALGHGPVPGPFFSSGVLAPLLINAAGSDSQKEQYLPALAAGQNVCAFALTEPEWGWGWDAVQTTATPSGDGYTITGTKLFVFDAYSADYLIVIARNGDEIVPAIVDTKADGVSIRRMKGFLTSECVVKLENVKVSADAVLSGDRNVLHDAMLRATPILCAQLVGGAQEAYQMSVEYSRARKQFGQPIGRFQHVQNH